MKVMMRFLWLAALFQLSCGLPNKFVDEGIADLIAITGAFAPNPRNDGKPMLFLSAKEGKIVVLEDPDNSDDSKTIANMGSRMCTNGERGLQSIRPHPDFENNQYMYMYYSVKTDGCKESATDGPINRLSRFKVSKTTLNIEMDSEFILLETSPAAKRVHNGGTIQFGNDGKLWVTIGDGGSRKPPVSQDRGILYGSILRLNDDGTVPSDNPYVKDGVRCGQRGGTAPSGKRCSEIYAYGVRNPFRLVMDPNTKDKVKFHVGDVGASAWEEISVGGSDYAGANYGWPPKEGPCNRGDNKDCPVDREYLDPFYYYEHTRGSEGGAVTGSAFVPEGLWPKKYKYLFIDFIFNKIYNLIEDKDREKRNAKPPVPGYRNETFHSHFRMVDMFFGPYKNTQALYYVARSDGRSVRRIRYTGSGNRAPDADIDVDDKTVAAGGSVRFDGRDSSDADGDDLDFFWDFDDGSTSTDKRPEHTFDKKGEYTVTLTITDERGQTDQAFVNIVVGSAPSAVMISPKKGDEFYVGQRLQLIGSGVDSDGNELDSSQFFWEVRQHHAEHFHPFRDRKAGDNIRLSPAPEPEDFNAANNSYLEVIMYAVDSDGLETKVSRQIMPKLVFVDVDSDPQGLKVLIDEFSVTTPGTITTWENHELRLDVKKQGPFRFDFWSDAGAHQHSITVPAASSDNLYISATFQEDTTFPGKIPLIGNVRDCSSGNRCQQCEGHCSSDNECSGSLVCFTKEGKGGPVLGCIGTDNSRTSWCTSNAFLDNNTPPSPTPRPPAPPSPSSPTSGGISLISDVRDCSSGNTCQQCEGSCSSDNECSGSLVCFKKGGKGRPVPGCIGIDNSRTSWCTSKTFIDDNPSSPTPLPPTIPTPSSPTSGNIRFVSDVVACSSGNKCDKCEGHCQNDDECKYDLRCFMKGGRGKSVPGCIGTDNSNTDWCTDADF